MPHTLDNEPGSAQRGRTAALADRLKEFQCVVTRTPMRYAIQALHARDFSLAQVSTLLALRERGAWSIGDMAQEIGLSLAATSQMVERLVREGLVHREEDPDDRRRKHLALSPQGAELLESIDRAYFQAMESAFRQVPPELVDRLEEALGGVIRHFAPDGPPHPGC